jgi:hypothetical protein
MASGSKNRIIAKEKRDGRLKWDPITLEEQLGR